LYNKALSSTEVNTLYTYENANPTLSWVYIKYIPPGNI
jgi:hypothetical protein